MIDVLKENLLSMVAVLFCLVLGAAAQLWVPILVYQVYEGLINGSPWVATSVGLALVALLKGVGMTFAGACGAKLEVSVCYSLRDMIRSSVAPLSSGQKLTLIKEDAERVASALIDVLNILASLVLVVVATIYLLCESILFAMPLFVALIAIVIYLRLMRSGVEGRYLSELAKDELYKSEVGNLVVRLGRGEKLFCEAFKSVYGCVSASAQARFIFDRWRAMVSFVPEFALSLGMVLVLWYVGVEEPKMFGSKIIIYMGYLGIVSMSIMNAVEMALSLMGADQSIARIRRSICH